MMEKIAKNQVRTTRNLTVHDFITERGRYTHQTFVTVRKSTVKVFEVAEKYSTHRKILQYN